MAAAATADDTSPAAAAAAVQTPPSRRPATPSSMRASPIWTWASASPDYSDGHLVASGIWQGVGFAGFTLGPVIFNNLGALHCTGTAD